MFERLKEVARAFALAGVAISCTNDQSAEAGLLDKGSSSTLDTNPNFHRYYQVKNDQNGNPQLDLLHLKVQLEHAVFKDPANELVKPTAYTEPATHEIVSGDTYGKLAKNYYGDSSYWKELHEYNQGKIGVENSDPKKLRIGDIIYIPDKNEISDKRETEKAAARIEALKKLPTYIETKDDDSLVAVAIRAYGDGQAWPVIAALNPGVEFCPEDGIDLRIRCDYGTTIYTHAHEVDRLLYREIPPVLARYPDKMSVKETSFFNNCSAYALEVERTFGIPAEVTLAQAALESDWGKRAPGNNYFGIKSGGSWSGGIVTILTREANSNGELLPTNGDFRTYDSCYASFIGYGAFLSSNPRYEKAFYCLNDPEDFIAEIREAEYATDPKYTSKVASVMNRFTRDSEEVEKLAPAPEGLAYYTVRSGDTFQKIAKAKLGSTKDWPIIQRANPGVDSSDLSVGQTILVPLNSPPDR